MAAFHKKESARNMAAASQWNADLKSTKFSIVEEPEPVLRQEQVRPCAVQI